MTATIPVGIGGDTYGVAVTSDDSKVYITSAESDTVSDDDQQLDPYDAQEFHIIRDGRTNNVTST